MPSELADMLWIGFFFVHSSVSLYDTGYTLVSRKRQVVAEISLLQEGTEKF
jgi:hypothetical protein